MDYIVPTKPIKTLRRDEILRYIAVYVTDHHNAPSTIDIARQFEIAPQTAYGHMMKLMVEGRLQQVDGQWKLPEAQYIPPPSLD